jgi:hypothetical protein
MKGQNISDRLLDFSVRIGKVVDRLPDTRPEGMLRASLSAAGPHLHQIMKRPASQKAAPTSFTS